MHRKASKQLPSPTKSTCEHKFIVLPARHPSSQRSMANLKKVGPYGYGSLDGNIVDIDWNKPPEELVSIEIWGNHNAGGMIYAMSFTYRDEKGDLVPVGPWGSKKGEIRTISIANNLVALRGSTSGSYVTSLTFKTSITQYGDSFFCGDTVSDDNFSIDVRPNSIVAFFGRSDEGGLRAIGAYSGPRAASVLSARLDRSFRHGSVYGNAVDINRNNPPEKLLSIEIWSKNGPNGMMNGISFIYRDEDGGFVPTDPAWGIKQGQRQLIPIEDEDEYLITLTGSTNSTNVTSLTFKTNKNIYGPYGKSQPADTPFCIDVGPNNSIVAFYGRADEGGLRAIGAHIYSGPQA
ncbi:hypothetical protein VPH35_133446 [Triticum aestivum]